MKNGPIPDEAASGKWRPRRKRFLRAVAVLFGVAIALWLGGVRLYAFPGLSMVPVVNPGDHLLALVGPWNLRSPKRFDMVIFNVPSSSKWAGSKVPWMKRVVGLSGEHLRLCGQDMFINGHKVASPFLHRDNPTSQPKEIEVALGENQFFVIGDNLDCSFDDSRSMGPIDRSLIKGLVALVIRTATGKKVMNE